MDQVGGEDSAAGESTGNRRQETGKQRRGEEREIESERCWYMEELESQSRISRNESARLQSRGEAGNQTVISRVYKHVGKELRGTLSRGEGDRE